MKTEETKASEGLDIAGLLALKAFESPDKERIEKNVQSTLQAVRAAHKRPSLHLFPDKSTAWMFAQPRYGIAALFIVFLGLHLMSRPISTETVSSASVSSAALEEPALEEMLSAVNATTNSPPILLPIPAVRQPNYSSLIQPVTFNE